VDGYKTSYGKIKRNKFMKTVYSYENVLNLIKSLKFETIANSDIIDLICSFGLNFDSRDIYGEYKNCMNKPEELGLWQRPKQLSSLIKHLLDHCDINSFLEVGTFKSSTFLILREFLSLKNKNLKAVTIDPGKFVSDEILNHFKINYKQIGIDKIQEQYDLIFIDGNHSYNAVKQDYQKALELKPKYILFHDIVDKNCPDVVKFWNEIKHNLNYKEFTDCDDLMGLGLVEL